MELRGEDSNLDFAVQSRADLPIIRPRKSTLSIAWRPRFRPRLMQTYVRVSKGMGLGGDPLLLRGRSYPSRVATALRILEPRMATGGGAGRNRAQAEVEWA